MSGPRNVIVFPIHRARQGRDNAPDGAYRGAVRELNDAYRAYRPVRVQAAYAKDVYPNVFGAWIGFQTALRRLGTPDRVNEAAYVYPRAFTTCVGARKIPATMRIYGHLLSQSVEANQAIQELPLPRYRRAQALGDVVLWKAIEDATVSYEFAVDTREVNFPELVRPYPNINTQSIQAVLNTHSVGGAKDHFARIADQHIENLSRWTDVVMTASSA